METSSPEVQQKPHLTLVSGVWYRVVWYVDTRDSEQPDCTGGNGTDRVAWLGL